MEPTGRRFTIAAGLLLLPLSSRSVADVLFVDATIGSGLETFVHTPNYLSTPGANEWFLGGIGVADFNSDGWPDFIVTKGGVGADRLYLNNGNGTFTNAAAPWGVDAVHAGNGVSCADFDRDGDVDVYMTSYGSSTQNTGTPGQNRLYRNEGLFFTNVASSAGVAFTSPSSSVGDSAAWGDYDLDGDLDLATSGWSASGLANRLFRNDGGSFLDVSSTSISIPASWGFQPTFIDLTDDGFPELLLAADFQTSRAWRNNRDGSFALSTPQFGLGLDDNGMGACIADLDGNATPDYFVTSVHMARPNPGMYNGNALYMNAGDAACEETAFSAGCSDGGWGWGTIAGDFDHDGWEDIAMVNGRNAGEWATETEYIFHNNGGVNFTRLGRETGISLAADARCVVTFDYDHDGDLDLLIFVNSGPLTLYRNETNSQRPWLTASLICDAGSRCAPHGIGSVVEVTVEGNTYRRFPHSGSGFHSSSEPLVHFGFPSGTVASAVRVHWPSGQTTELLGVPLNSRLALKAPSAADLDASGSVGSSDVQLLIAEWGEINRADRSMRRADLDNDSVVGARDLALLLSEWDE